MAAVWMHDASVHKEVKWFLVILSELSDAFLLLSLTVAINLILETVNSCHFFTESKMILLLSLCYVLETECDGLRIVCCSLSVIFLVFNTMKTMIDHLGWTG